MTDSHRAPRVWGLTRYRFTQAKCRIHHWSRRRRFIKARRSFPDSDVAAGLFNIERAGHVYSRLSNPTNAVLKSAWLR